MSIERIVVYGLGAIGSNVLIQLLRQYPNLKYEGVDFDKVEDRNIRIQAFFQEHVGQPKAQAIKGVGLRYVRKFEYMPHVKKVIQPISGMDDKTLALDCFDNTESRKLLRGHSNILHLGFSPLYSAECLWDAVYDVPGDVDSTRADICQLHDAVGFIHYFVNFATLAISDFITTGKKSNFLITNKVNVKKL